MQSKITLELSRTNALLVAAIAEVLKKPIAEIVSSCIRGLINPDPDNGAINYARKV